MDYINQSKADFETAFNALPEARRTEIAEYYGTKPLTVLVKIMQDCKQDAESLLNFADRKGYGIGEIGYNINEYAKAFGEDVPELERAYRNLLTDYIDFIDEAKKI